MRALIGPEALPGPYVLLTATDTGQGMSHATMDQVFEPFFTTKPTAEGTGLGLSVVFGIMRQARGSVRVTSAPGQGATFTVAWPASERDTPPVAVPAVRATEHGRSRKRVLIVEDDPTVLRIVRRVLEDAGYETFTAVDGQDALDQLHVRTHDGDGLPDIVLSDVLMPRVNGHELVRRLYTTWPALPVILMSGHTGLERLDDLPPTVALPVITKPFEVAMLTDAIARVLPGARVP